VSQPAIQDFVAARATDAILENAPTVDVATTLLGEPATRGKNFDELTVLVRPVIEDSIKQIMASASFAKLWHDTNQAAHSILLQQISAGSPTLSLDLTPAVAEAIAELKTTKLSVISDKIEIKPDTGKITLKGGAIDKAHQYYKLFQTGTVALVLLTLLFIGLAITISVHHTKTIRRILVGTGILSLVLAASLQLPSMLRLANEDAATQAAAGAITHVLFHNLQLAALILGIACLVVAGSSKLYDKTQGR
jgi:hypothetical protein